jgi:hypothetical protein
MMVEEAHAPGMERFDDSTPGGRGSTRPPTPREALEGASRAIADWVAGRGARYRCPAGHVVRSPHALHCPTCGRYLAGRFARVCPRGHRLAGPYDVCPICREKPGARAIWLYALAGALSLYLVIALVGYRADLAGRLIERVQSLWAMLQDVWSSLPLPRL